MLWVFIRYNKGNKVASTTTHNTPIEIAWTIVPVFILIGIGIISLPILLKQLRIPDSEVVIKATGNQWYWTYDYPQHDFSFDSVMLEKDELEEYGYSQDEYLLATDNPVVVPVNKNITVQVTASMLFMLGKLCLLVSTRMRCQEDSLNYGLKQRRKVCIWAVLRTLRIKPRLHANSGKSCKSEDL